jgi:hypothetical protein
LRTHQLFISQLLDPDEQALIKAADAYSKVFAKLEANPGRGGSGDPAMKAAETIIDFKTAAEKGIRASQIQSIIHPALADHVRREAVRFKDELQLCVAQYRQSAPLPQNSPQALWRLVRVLAS